MQTVTGQEFPMFSRPWRIPRRWKVLFWQLSDRLLGARVAPLPPPEPHPLESPTYQRRRSLSSQPGE
ncbi:hypothetical protein Thi970DRAFT_00059 [Thiorhodovibrio frisius]|uniref:Uncharacterized protein n=2 Tax=Chromatiaceae TaxID=1046 RepID=H8YVI4_9GAMM|nr:hypothetical protein Thi970DRAFT_00059 [Thiorhodovibrio frisius]MBK5968815.1 hypothetical protein [Thiorhodovibrio winogradskyi]